MSTFNKLVSAPVAFSDHYRTVVAGMKQERDDHGAPVGTQTLSVADGMRPALAG